MAGISAAATAWRSKSLRCIASKSTYQPTSNLPSLSRTVTTGSPTKVSLEVVYRHIFVDVWAPITVRGVLWFPPFT